MDITTLDHLQRALNERPPAIVSDMASYAADGSRAKIEKAIAEFEMDLEAWLLRVAEMRAAAKDIAVRGSEPDAEKLAVFEVAIEKLDAAVDADRRAVARLLKNIGRLLQRVQPAQRAPTLSVASKAQRLMDTKTNALVEFAYDLRGLAANLDPEARGGPAFSNAKDLAKYLRHAPIG